jgi:CRP-like cAMP-binding protein
MDVPRLMTIPLFAGVDEASLAALAGAATEVQATEGETIATEGDFGHALYAIESGTADVVSAGNTLRSLGPGDVFGEIAVIAAGRRSASVVATSPMRLVAFFKRDVWALERRAPEAAERLRSLIGERTATQSPPS